MPVSPDLVALLRELSAADARFLVVGAYAIAHHSRPRSTAALDIWVEPTPDNAALVHRALRAFGAPLADLSVSELTQPDLVYQIGLAPRRIDILTSITGVMFPEAWSSKVTGLGEAECSTSDRSPNSGAVVVAIPEHSLGSRPSVTKWNRQLKEISGRQSS